MKTISAALLGAPLDPFSNRTRQHIGPWSPFLAWIGLGADGLSLLLLRSRRRRFSRSASHTHLAPSTWRPATALNGPFVIAVGYNQVIELFPLRGGGGYKGRDQSDRSLYGGWSPAPALIVDYMLTIAILCRKRRRCCLQPAGRLPLRA